MGDTEIQMDMKVLKNRKNEFTMKVGKQEAKVMCRNKREGKQLASQAILKVIKNFKTAFSFSIFEAGLLTH